MITEKAEMPPETLSDLLPEIDKLKGDKLRTFAEEAFGIHAEESVSDVKLRKQLREIAASQRENADKANLEAAEELAAVEPDDNPPVRGKFRNLLDPGVDVEFSYDCGKGIDFSRNYHLYDGQETTIPYKVMLHLQSLKIPDDKYDLDPATGHMTLIKKGFRDRFAFEPFFTAEQIVALSAEKKGKVE